MVAGCYRNVRLGFQGLAAVSALVALCGAGSPSPISNKPVTPTSVVDNAGAPFAVVELFTSEFCGACPAADQLLSEIGAEARRAGKRVMPLAFHVDYFDSGNAADPFGNPLFSKRQNAYAAANNSDDLYTPQMLVNGRSPFVGSQRETAAAQIRAALSKPATAAVKMNVANSDNPAAVKVNFDVQGMTSSANLQVAVVERHLVTRVRGYQEHDNVVRLFKSVSLSNGTRPTVELTLPRNVNRKNVTIVGYVQDTRTMSIRGAAGLDLAPAPVERVASAEK